MKAIEILFEKIDELNTELKQCKTIHEKVCKAYKIKSISQLIEDIYELADNNGYSDDDYI